MDWGARLRAAWHGEVSNADLGAMFAATARLADLQQALADRRLAAQIEHTGHDWRALLAVGPISAPLWLADALVGIAGALYDTESPAPADHSAVISAYTHDLIADLLAPVEDIFADVTAALADPGHHTALTRPLHVGPGGDIAAGRLPDLPRSPYARGLASGARRIHTSAAAALADARSVVTRAESPQWLEAGLRRLDGELQGAGARLDVIEVRLPPLLEQHGGDAAALAAACRDLWTVIDAAVVAGQVTADPHLLPEARAAAEHAAPAATPWTPPAPPQAPPRHVRPVTLPRIAEGAPDARQSAAATGEPDPHAAPPTLSLPIVGGQETNSSSPTKQSVAPISLPEIGGSPEPSTTAPGPEHPSHMNRPGSGDPPTQDEEQRFRLPDIG